MIILTPKNIKNKSAAVNCPIQGNNENNQIIG